MQRQRVLITGGASGIGLMTAQAFLQAGASVFVCDKNAEALASMRQRFADVATGICDMSVRADVERMVAQGATALGGIDVLVNNAGISGPTALVEHLDPEAWEQVMQVNLTGTFNATRMAIPHLKKSASGVIIIMSSLAGRFGYPARSPYCVSKWGLIGLMKTLAIELGDDGIRVNAVLPGAVEGPRLEAVLAGRAAMANITLDQASEGMMSIQTLKRFVDPNDVAALCVFLASDAAKSISGQAIPIDSGALKAS
jgi:NAD(P)-dependent dehydrogenase (short-subunit alcohol dehydrogenase family)